jgi:S1-C subfamily serine protease
MKKKSLWLMVSVTLVVLGVMINAQSAKAITKNKLYQGMRSTVRLITPLDADETLASFCAGTVIDQAGYIVTSFHCIGQSDVFGEDTQYGLQNGDYYNSKGEAEVAVSDEPDSSPMPTYMAQVVAGNADEDVAVLKIVSFLDSNEELAEPLPLVAAKLADSDTVEEGAEVNALSYVGDDDESVNSNQGEILQLIDNNDDNATDWFLTSAEILYSSSGGAVLNDKGEVIGIGAGDYTDEKKKETRYYIKPINSASPVIERAMSVEDSQSNKPQKPGGGGDKNIPAGQNFGGISFGSGVDDNGELVDESTTFESGIGEVFGLFPYQKMKDGVSWSYSWLYEGQEAITEDNLKWDMGDSGNAQLSIYHKEGSLPDGQYGLQVFLRNKLVQEGEFVIGSEKPVDKPKKPVENTSEGVQLTGKIVDADTGKPIKDAALLVLKAGKKVRDFDRSEDMSTVLSGGMTNVKGIYTTDTPIPRGESYSVLVGAQGYQRLAEDDILSPADDTPDVLELDDIALQKR